MSINTTASGGNASLMTTGGSSAFRGRRSTSCSGPFG